MSLRKIDAQSEAKRQKENEMRLRMRVITIDMKRTVEPSFILS